jgi:hypothetical protein
MPCLKCTVETVHAVQTVHTVYAMHGIFSAIAAVLYFFREGAFWGLSKLTRLSLYDNKMTHIESGAFDGLTK